MLFNSIDFAIFLPIVFIIYWFLANKNLRVQNAFIVVASYFFYGWWNWKFLTLIALSTIVDYYVGLKLKDETNIIRRKTLLGFSIAINLGILGFFKYYNFFVDNLTTAFSFLGTTLKVDTLHIILPVGISFYTFQTLSYTIDVYRKKLAPTHNLITFAAFVSFFPQLVAGPIERASNLLPQFNTSRRFNYSKAVDGMRQILWGLFKKVVIADSCAEFANQIFSNSSELNGSALVFGAIFFTFQIYGDFSGYSDIAIGVARLFGFDLMKNFAFPYFSRNIAEFWRRWHISLTTWFRDYLYIPLGGSRGSTALKIRNIFIIFVVSGFWHGPNWTFITWGVLNAFFFLPLLLTNTNRKYLSIVALGKYWPSFKDILSIAATFSLTVVAWIFFRAENIEHALSYISKIASMSLFEIPNFAERKKAALILVIIGVFMMIEWLGRTHEFALQHITRHGSKATTRYIVYYLIVFAIFWFGGQEQVFVYFQF